MKYVVIRLFVVINGLSIVVKSIHSSFSGQYFGFFFLWLRVFME